MLANIINPNKEKIYARKCQIIEVDSVTERKFLESNHLDGYVQSSICWGLVCDNELIQIMSFGPDRWTKKDQLEMIRLCSKQNVAVIGGAERLFKKQLEITTRPIVSYSNNKFFSGDVNRRLGFKLAGNTTPGYKWMKNGVFLSRYQTQKHKLAKLLGNSFDLVLTEQENMQKNGWIKINDLGHRKWIYEV